MLESCKARSHILTSLLHSIHRYASKYHNLNTKRDLVEKVLSYCSAYNITQSILKPVGYFMFAVRKTEKIWCSSNFVKHKWIFDVHKSVRVNMTFTDFYIKDKLRGCRRGNLSVYSLTVPIYLCGILPVFMFYSIYSNVRAYIHFLEYIPTHFTLTYSVFSNGTLSSMKQRTQFKVNPIAIHHIWTLRISVNTYHLTVSKYLHICVTDIPLFYAILIDGPDYGAMPVVIHSNRSCLSTFQCLLQVEIEIQNHIVTMLPIKYAGQKASALEWRHPNGLQMETIPTKKCASTNFCVLFFSLPSGYYLNITIQTVLFAGLSTDDCKFGGLSFYDGRQHLVDVCKNITRQMFLRNLLVSKRSAFLVSYSYPGVSIIRTNYAVDLTRCTPIRFDVCKFNFFCQSESLISNCISHLESISNNTAVLFEKGSDRFLKKSLELIFLFPEVPCSVVQLSSDFRDTVFYDDPFDSDYCKVDFFPKPVAKNEIGLQFALQGFVEKRDAAPISAPIILKGKVDVLNTALINWHITDINSTVRICRNVHKTSCLLCNHKSLSESCFKMETSQFCKICTYDQPVSFFIDYISLTPVLQNKALTTILLGKSMDMHIDLIIKHNKLTFEEDSVIPGNISFDLGTSLLSQDIFVVQLMTTPMCNHEISQSKSKTAQIEFVAAGLTQVVKDRFSPTFEGIWMGNFHLTYQHKHISFAAPGTLKQLKLKAKSQVKVAISWLTAISNTIRPYFCDIQKLCRQNVKMYYNITFKNGSTAGRAIMFHLKLGTFLFQFREYVVPSSPTARHRKHSKGILKKTLTLKYHLRKEFEFDEKDYMSWSLMAQHCSDLGGHLPVFYSRTELEELLSLLIMRPDLPILEAIYVGLQLHIEKNGKVVVILIFS